MTYIHVERVLQATRVTRYYPPIRNKEAKRTASQSYHSIHVERVLRDPPKSRVYCIGKNKGKRTAMPVLSREGETVLRVTITP